ncbi:uncharacterized protein B0H18DRAFT_1005544 [Fomitopsis serialis]|uniref:uncharacterized protein n=1 Tax=Fomitopsis serialis TaxID=139415 RepID=UPI002007A4DD|nr:uncharacterized protein B0H18DRAFT_1005544 [Neoantrodia serialis]KAH9926783.1 hypothetical protein B0H18DRAFT_1005544 [Neoantrodia serialis]
MTQSMHLNLPPGTTTDAHAPRPPEELWDHVIDHLWDDSPALWACSLTCREWVPETRHHLFTKVHLYTKRDCLRLQDVLQNSELVGTNVHEYVTSVVISGIRLPLCRKCVESDNCNTMLLHAIFTRLPRVLSLDLSTVDFKDCPRSGNTEQDAELRPFSHLFPFPQLRELRLSAVFDSRDDFIRLLAAFPQLSYLTTGEVLWMCRETNGAPLGLAERESARRVFNSLKTLSISNPLSLRWGQMRVDIYSDARRSREIRFDWTTYLADHRHLVLQLLHDSAPNVEQLCITTAASLAEFDSHLCTNVRDVKLVFRDLEMRKHLPFSAAFPTFLSRLASRDLTVLTLCFRVSSISWTAINWSLVDWPAVDDVLVHLHRRNADFKVIFRIACVPRNTPMLLGHCASSADIAKGLTDFLSGATGAQARVGVSAYCATGPVFYISPSQEELLVEYNSA